MKNPSWSVVGLALLSAFALVFFFEPLTKSTPDVAFTPPLRAQGKYKFINPLLECDAAQGVIDAPKQQFERELSVYLESPAITSKASMVAVYFRDLNNGPSFGVNTKEEFIPASLLKTPVMMAWYRASEDDPALLQKEIHFLQEAPSPEGLTQLIPPRESLVPGKTYRADELIRRAIVYSDNQSLQLLVDNLPPSYVRELYASLDVPEAVLNGPDGRLSVKDYATFFRILFNASYLNHENSERALALLAESEFADGLVAGVPAGVVVAHKFGEAGDEVVHQIHDCGVVYYPNHPYLLCVMTRGSSILGLEEAIAATSRFVYDKIDAQYKVKRNE